MSYSTLIYSHENNVAEITLNRPEALNALSLELLAELAEVCSRAKAENARAVLITGAGRAFCAGADLGPSTLVRDKKGEIALGAGMENYFYPAMRALWSIEVPIVTAINGVAAGGGSSIALTGDIAIASTAAVFRPSPVNIGLVPDLAATYLLPRLVGTARANGIMMLCEPISAQKALEWGMIWQVVEPGTLLDSARKTAAKLANSATLAQKAVKNSVRQSLFNDYEKQLGVERELQDVLGRSKDFTEGVTAFWEKRPAQFSGS
ncbi:MAG TPA: enoyl-CoA hydratase-related protein [Pseudomonadales bacterium]|nr:enoyl-CoA hydratase-related protein [Pseudomonadales bacterium]